MKLSVYAGCIAGVMVVVASACSSEDEFSSKPVEDAGTDTAATGGSGGSGGNDASADSAGGVAGMDAAAEVCSDSDADGVTDCNGDCDDSDPANFPGNPEVCGDNADNDCDGTPDQTCGGLGTYVSLNTGDDANTGTKDMPVKTIGKGIQNAVTIQGTTAASIDVFVAEGHYPEKVTLTEKVNLLGGFSCTAQPCSWARDPAQYDTAILNQDFEGVLADNSITKATRIDGFRIMGMTGDPTGNPPGTVALTLEGGTPTVVNNTIVGGDSQGGSYLDGHSFGIALIPPANDLSGALIDNNVVTGGGSVNNVSAAIGFVDSGGAIGKTYALVTRNTLKGGTASASRGIVAWASGTGTIIRNNDIQGGEGSNNSWGIDVGSIALIDSNRINTDTTAPAKSPNTANWSGGIQSASSTTVIVNNVVLGADAFQSAAVRLAEFETPAGAVVLNSNYLDGLGTATSKRSAALVLTHGQCCGNNTVFGRVNNNILVGGAGTQRYGVYEENVGGKTAHPESFLNNLIFIPNTTAADALYVFWNGGSASAKTTIADVNALAQQLGSVANNQAGDPMVDATWHLVPGSPCVDTGTATDAPAQDFEGDARPVGSAHDIGPDESQ